MSPEGDQEGDGEGEGESEAFLINPYRKKRYVVIYHNYPIEKHRSDADDCSRNRDKPDTDPDERSGGTGKDVLLGEAFRKGAAPGSVFL